METNINNFMDHITLINKDISVYEDNEKGILFHLNTIQLIAKVERYELSAEEYKMKKFDGSVEDLDYEIIEVERPVPKNTITNKDEDKYTIVINKIKVRVIYNVSNALGIKKSFTNKDEAFTLANEINEKVLPYFK